MTPAEHAATVRHALRWIGDGVERGRVEQSLVALAERATELEAEVTRSESKRYEATMRQEQAEARATELERELRLLRADEAAQAIIDAGIERERAERAETALAEEREEHSATKETANGWREFLDIERAARERAETALRMLWENYLLPITDEQKEQVRAALGETAR